MSNGKYTIYTDTSVYESHLPPNSESSTSSSSKPNYKNKRFNSVKR